MDSLADRHCTPHQPGDSPLSAADIGALSAQLGGGWQVLGGRHLEKKFKFPDFVTALAFVNRVGEMAEQQGHHPDMLLSWGQVHISLTTHDADGLTEADFIVAARAERLAEAT